MWSWLALVEVGEIPPPRHGGVEKRGLKALSFTEESQIQGQRQELAW